MKTIADIKRAFTLGSKWNTIYHKEFAGRIQDEHGKEVILYKDKDLGTREISIVQTTQVAFATTKADGTVKDSWIGFPKAKEVIFNANSFTVLDYDGAPVLTYSPVKDQPQTNPAPATGHTPGNWTISDPDFEHFSIEANGEQIAEVYRPIVINEDTQERYDIAEANARLIASAPELLEVLKTIQSVLNGWNTEGKYINLIEHAKSAIQKAVGAN